MVALILILLWTALKDFGRKGKTNAVVSQAGGWEQGYLDSSGVYYKKSGQGHEWFTSDLLHDLDPAKQEGEIKLFDPEPDTEYETRGFDKNPWR